MVVNLVNKYFANNNNQFLCHHNINSPHLIVCTQTLECGHDVCLKCSLKSILSKNFAVCSRCLKVSKFNIEKEITFRQTFRPSTININREISVFKSPKEISSFKQFDMKSIVENNLKVIIEGSSRIRAKGKLLE